MKAGPLHCHACGYDIGATIAAGLTTCPECGAEISERQSVEQYVERQANRVMRRWAMLASATFFFGSVFEPLIGLTLSLAFCAASGQRCAQLLRNCPYTPESKSHFGLVISETFGTLLYALLFAIPIGLLFGIVAYALSWI